MERRDITVACTGRLRPSRRLQSKRRAGPALRAFACAGEAQRWAFLTFLSTGYSSIVGRESCAFSSFGIAIGARICVFGPAPGRWRTTRGFRGRLSNSKFGNTTRWQSGDTSARTLELWGRKRRFPFRVHHYGGSRSGRRRLSSRPLARDGARYRTRRTDVATALPPGRGTRRNKSTYRSDLVAGRRAWHRAAITGPPRSDRPIRESSR